MRKNAENAEKCEKMRTAISPPPVKFLGVGQQQGGGPICPGVRSCRWGPGQRVRSAPLPRLNKDLPVLQGLGLGVGALAARRG